MAAAEGGDGPASLGPPGRGRAARGRTAVVQAAPTSRSSYSVWPGAQECRASTCPKMLLRRMPVCAMTRIPHLGSRRQHLAVRLEPDSPSSTYHAAELVLAKIRACNAGGRRIAVRYQQRSPSTERSPLVGGPCSSSHGDGVARRSLQASSPGPPARRAPRPQPAMAPPPPVVAQHAAHQEIAPVTPEERARWAASSLTRQGARG